VSVCRVLPFMKGKRCSLHQPEKAACFSQCLPMCLSRTQSKGLSKLIRLHTPAYACTSQLILNRRQILRQASSWLSQASKQVHCAFMQALRRWHGTSDAHLLRQLAQAGRDVRHKRGHLCIQDGVQRRALLRGNRALPPQVVDRCRSRAAGRGRRRRARRLCAAAPCRAHLAPDCHVISTSACNCAEHCGYLLV